MPPAEIVFPDTLPRYESDRDTISFPAHLDGRLVTCVVSGELLMQMFEARGPSQEDLLAAYRENRDAIQVLARTHIEMGWISPDDEVPLTTRFTRLNVTYGCGIRRWRSGLLLAQQAFRRLAELIGPSAGEVNVEWDRGEGSHGRSVITLRLSDAFGATIAVLEPWELESPAQMRVRLARLWGDLLEFRSQKQLQQLLTGPMVG